MPTLPPVPSVIPPYNEVVRRFRAECKAVLLTRDVDKCVAFLMKWNPGLQPPSSREVAVLMMHKAITGNRDLPVEFRRESKRFLINHNSLSLDDGDL